jgi:flagellar secretion chaperone FliS
LILEQLMLPPNRGSRLAKYRQAGAEEAHYATPHRLVQMLMEGALDKIAIAKGAVERKDIQARHDHIFWAESIINGLRSSLDFDKGGEIARNLDALYDYMSRRLLEANNRNDAAILDEVSDLMKEIKGAWDTMPENIRNARTRAEIEASMG